MDDIRQEDRRLLTQELLSPMRLLLLLPIVLFLFLAVTEGDFGAPWSRIAVLAGFPLAAVYALTAYQAAERRRFRNKRMAALWNGCRDRMARFEEVLAKMRREQVGELREMPQTIRAVAQSVYVALRRADLISDEVQATEKGFAGAPPVWEAAARDAQSKELYRLADKNIAEYRSQLAGVMAGVQRTEAQTAVFMTTLDTLRMKMIGYRLVGRSPELASGDFLTALAEARAQLQAIDHALEELDLSHYPRQISVVPVAAVGEAGSPPPMPDDARDAIELKRRLGD